MSKYKDLDVWIFSMETVVEVYNLTKKYPKDEKYGLVSQTTRAAVSIPANIAEGLGRNHKKDTLQFLYVSRGSAYELETLVGIARMIDMIDDQAFSKMNNIVEKNIRVLNGFINYLEQKI